MRFITTPAEFQSTTSLILAMLEAMPGGFKASGEIKNFKEMNQAYLDAVEEDTNDARDAFNDRYGSRDSIVQVYMNDDNEITMDVSEELIIQVNKAIEEEVPTWAGIIVSLVGVAMMFKTSFKRLGDRLDKISANLLNTDSSN